MPSTVDTGGGGEAGLLAHCLHSSFHSFGHKRKALNYFYYFFKLIFGHYKKFRFNRNIKKKIDIFFKIIFHQNVWFLFCFGKCFFFFVS